MLKATSAERSDSGDAIVIVIYDKDSWSFPSIIGILYYNITLIFFNLIPNKKKKKKKLSQLPINLK